MKRQLTIGLMLAAAFTLTNCSEQLVSPDVENETIVDETINDGSADDVRIPYEVIVNEPTTKTISNGENLYWVDEATAAANGLGKQGTDKINLFSKASNVTSYTSHDVFVYAGGKKFVGELTGSMGTSNNWYAIYPYSSDNTVSTDADADIKGKITIGASKEASFIQTQKAADSKAHIAGPTCPMYHYLENHPGTSTPTFTMNHLSALLAIEIVNAVPEGSQEVKGDIIINSAEINFPAEQIVGDFDVKIKGKTVMYTPVANSTSNTAAISLGGASFTIPANGTTTLYMAVKPFDASGQKLTISINGSTKSVTLPTNVKFEAGKLTKLRVPLKLTAPAQSNVFEINKGKHASLVGSYSSFETMYINGHRTDVAVLGTPAKPGQVKISGTPKELLNMVPVTFYASSYGNNQGVMRVESISANILLTDFTFDYNRLITMMSPERITFSGVLPLEQYKRNGVTYITVLDENPILKEVSEENIETLLLRFDDNANDGKTPTFEGLLAAINNPDAIGNKDANGNDTPATITAQCVYNKIEPILQDKAGDLWSLASWLIGSPKGLFGFIDDLEVTVVLSTVDKNESDKDLATDNRVMAWGIHATTN